MTDIVADIFRAGWLQMPDRRNAALYRRLSVNPSTYALPVTLTNCWHRDFKKNSRYNGQYLVSECKFHIPKSANTSVSLASNAPSPGDQFEDSPSGVIPYLGSRWTVDDVSEVGALGAWQLKCVAVGVNNAVAVTIKIQQPNESLTSAGQRVVSGWTDISTQTAFVQIGQGVNQNVFDKQQLSIEGIVVLPTEVALTAQMTVFDVVANKRYNIENVRYPQDFISMQEVELKAYN